MRWVIAPDSFKGSLSAAKVAAALARGIARVDPSAELLLRPMADGGEGTLEALCAAGLGQWRHARVAGVDGTVRPVRWLGLEDGAAVVEVAEVVGLPDAGGTRPGQRSTVGVGALIRAVLDTGCRRILIGLGGSSTTDGGAGCLVALGHGFWIRWAKRWLRFRRRLSTCTGWSFPAWMRGWPGCNGRSCPTWGTR